MIRYYDVKVDIKLHFYFCNISYELNKYTSVVAIYLFIKREKNKTFYYLEYIVNKL